MGFYLKCFIDHADTADLSKSCRVQWEPTCWRSERLPKCISQLDNTGRTPANTPRVPDTSKQKDGHEQKGVVMQRVSESLPPSTIAPPPQHKGPFYCMVLQVGKQAELSKNEGCLRGHRACFTPVDLGASLARTKSQPPPWSKVKKPEEGHCTAFTHTGRLQNPAPASQKPVVHPMLWFSVA